MELDEGTLKRLKSFYLESAVKGYATGETKRSTIPELPGSRVFPNTKGEFRYADLYFKSRTRSYGLVTLWIEEVPVWVMHRHGSWRHHDKRVGPFLKMALSHAYSSKEFLGGRGPLIFRHGSLVYANHPDPKSNFTDFRGYEWITGDQTHIWDCEYSGGLL